MEVGTGYGLLVQLLRTCVLCICPCDTHLRVSTHTACVVIAVNIRTVSDVVSDVCDHIVFDSAVAVTTSCHPLLLHRYHHTVPMTNVYALREGLAILAEEVSLTCEVLEYAVEPLYKEHSK